MQKKNELQKLKDKLLDLQSGNLDAEVDNPKIVKCWERLNCNKTDCPAYGKLRCWSIAGTLCHGRILGEHALKLGDCTKCIVYQESCGDELSELYEVFNQTVKELKYNFNQEGKRIERNERLSNLGQMAATVAHETRNPLQAIGYTLDYLKKNFQGNILTEFLSVIESEVSRLNGVIDSFLRFAQPLAPTVEQVAINQLLDKTLNFFTDEAAEKNITITFQPGKHLEPFTTDPTLLRQAVSYLLDNALATSTAGKNIFVFSSSDEEGIHIMVKDQGPGIPEDKLDMVTRPFYTSKTRGVGLGLAMVDRIMESLHGSVSFKNAQNGGLEVHLVLPPIP